MKSLVVFDPEKTSARKVLKTGELSLDGMAFGIGLMECALPRFDSATIENQDNVLVEVLAFSCNYRDRAIVLGWLRSSESATPIHFGSDFVGVVRAVGRKVTTLTEGDRIIGNNSYPVAAVHEVSPGVPTNGASARFLVLHECKLAKVSQAMPLHVAAGFSIAAQTCYSMIRKLNIRGGERCLVTGASSNTALFALAILAARGVETYAVTTGSRDFSALDVAGTIRVKPPIDQSIAANEIARRLVRERGGAELIIDCFADIYAASVIPLLKKGGTYITCGIYAQSGIEPQVSLASTTWRDLLAFIIMNNVTIHGNCLGNESDLSKAIAEYGGIATRVPLDSVFGIEEGREFVARSLAASRFGKVILEYRPDAEA